MSGPRSSSLYNSIPQPAGTPYTPYDPPLGFMGTLENASIGMGRGMTNRLRGLLEAAQHPGNALRGLLDVAIAPPQQLGPQIRNALAQNFQQATSGPLGLGQAVGEATTMRGLLGVNALTQPGLLREMTAYHGSPHDFDKFDSSKIGTGEGAQAYGHGLYFAESPDVAKQYQGIATKLVSDAQARLKKFGGDVDATIADLSARAEKFRSGGAPQYAVGLEDDIRTLQQYKQTGQWPAGKMYQVDIPDDAIDKMLDWDKPWKDQPESVKEAFRKMGWDKEYRANLSDFSTPMTTRNKNMRGENLHAFIQMKAGGDAAKASQMLRDAGIPGIRYLDGGSRDAGKGSRNFVVFDDKIVKVLKKE